MDQVITLNWGGNKGIHKVEHGLDYPAPIPAANYVSQQQHWSKTYAFDRIYFYDASGDIMTRADTTNIYDGFSSPALDSVTGSGDLVTVTFSSSHDRITPNTWHNISMSGWTGSPSINGTHSATFVTSTTCTFSQSGAAPSYTGGTLNSDDVPYASFDNFGNRVFYNNYSRVDALSNPRSVGDHTGVYVGKSLFGSGRNAVVYRSMSGGEKVWSYGVDFAAAVYHRPLSTLPNSGKRWLFSMKSVDHFNTPTSEGQPDDEAVLDVNASFVYPQNGTEDRPAGRVEIITYYCAGTWAEVQAHLTTLNGYSDSSLGW
jgi:hypothetical protein